MLSYVLLCTRLSHFFLFLIIRLIYRTFTAAKGEVRIARYLERFFPVVSVLTYFYVRCGTSTVKITLSNALSELLVKVRSVVN